MGVRTSTSPSHEVVAASDDEIVFGFARPIELPSLLRVVPSSDGDGDLPADHADTWQWSYDQETVQQFMEDVEAERARLRAEIEAADQRVRAAEAAAAAAHEAASARSREAAEAELGAIVLAAHEELAVIERQHRRALETMRADAEAEAGRLLDEAREQAIAIRARAALVAQPEVELGPGESEPTDSTDR